MKNHIITLLTIFGMMNSQAQTFPNDWLGTYEGKLVVATPN